MFIVLYSLLLAVGLGVSAPWWLWRMATSGRYREGLGQRLGCVPAELKAAVAGRRVVWVHAVSVGEVLAAERMIAELRQVLGKGWVVVVSTTTAAGQKIARERLAKGAVFYFPLDFAFAVRAYLSALRPALVVLMESELWPRHLLECERAGVPVAVVNARVSDRSFPRYMRLRWLWKPLMAKVRVFLAQGQETAERLRAIGAERVEVTGNLKFDVRLRAGNLFLDRLRRAVAGKLVLVAGSTHEGEEKMLLDTWPEVLAAKPLSILVLAPRHPDRFDEVGRMISQSGFRWRTARGLAEGGEAEVAGGEIVLLDTIGDLAAVYELADAAFVGGSLVPRGGHNPLEAARFGVPVVMGRSHENFREIVEELRAEHGLIVPSDGSLGLSLRMALEEGREMGANGKRVFEARSGSTARTVEALMRLVHA